jgi:pyridoxamine---pyruvate transaminase
LISPPEFTLSAGPTSVSPGTLAALGSPVLYHYDPAFLEAFRRTEEKVARVLCTRNEVILMQGEAVLGLEAAARALVRPGMPVLNLVSGVFGDGMGEWLRGFGAVLHELRVPYNRIVDPEAVAGYLDAHPEVELLVLVHSETPSGTLHDLAAICAEASSRGVLTLADCVSSVGGMPVDTDQWGLDVCVAGPQKCIGGTPGLSLISVSERAWQAIGRNPEAPRFSFLSLLDWHHQWHGENRFPYTPSVSEVRALEAACDQLLAEGLAAAHARHDLAARACRAGARAMGLDLWPACDQIMSSCVTAVAVPEGIDHEVVRDHARTRYGVMISGGQGAGNIVRIGHMGSTASGLYPVVGLLALGRAFADLGVRIALGDGVTAAMDELSAASAAPAA